MGSVLTTDSQITCGHEGKVSTTSQSKLKVKNASVLVSSDVQGKSVSATPPDKCVTQLTSSTKPCSSVLTIIKGAATKLKVHNDAVLLADALKGTTDGNPPGSLSATAGQTKLTAT